MRCRFSTENTTYPYPQGFWSLAHCLSWSTHPELLILRCQFTQSYPCPHIEVFVLNLASVLTQHHERRTLIWKENDELDGYQHDLSCQCQTSHLRALLHESNTLRTHLTPCVGFSLAIYAFLLDPRELSIVNNRACDLAWAHLRVAISQCELKIHWAILWDN